MRGKVYKPMKDYCSGRSSTDLMKVYVEYFEKLIDVPEFIRLWDRLAKILRYPEPELMHIEDNLIELIEINNSRSIFVSEFDDVYEILEAIEIKQELIDVAIEERIMFLTIGDLLTFIFSKIMKI